MSMPPGDVVAPEHVTRKGQAVACAVSARNPVVACMAVQSKTLRADAARNPTVRRVEI
jgi:hypothetical protein